MDTTETTAPAATTAPSQPIVAPVVAKKSHKKLILALAVIAIVLIPLVAVGATAGVAATNLGKNNSFSKLSAFIPTEQVPLLNSLGKSDAMLLRDALATESDFDHIQALGGRAQKFDMNVVFAGTDPEKHTMDGNISMSVDSAVNKTNDKGKVNLVVGGNVKSGIINVDLGTEGFKGDFLIPNMSDYYMSFNMSQSLIDTIAPELESSGMASGDLKSYLNKYYKLNLKEYYEAMGIPSSMVPDPNKQVEASKNIAKALKSDVSALYNKTLGDFNRYATVTNKGRKTVAGQSSIVLGLSIDGTKAGPVTSEFVDGMYTVLKNHKSDLIAYCKATYPPTSVSGQSIDDVCTETDIETLLGSSLTDSDKKEIENQVSDFFKAYDLSGWTFYVNPVDNSIMKTEGSIIAKADGLKEFSTDGMDITKFQISMTSQEVNRGKDIDVQAPKDFTDLSKMIKEEMEKLQLPSSTQSQTDLEELLKAQEIVAQ